MANRESPFSTFKRVSISFGMTAPVDVPTAVSFSVCILGPLPIIIHIIMRFGLTGAEVRRSRGLNGPDASRRDARADAGPPHSPSFAAGLSRNSDRARIYFRSVFSD